MELVLTHRGEVFVGKQLLIQLLELLLTLVVVKTLLAVQHLVAPLEEEFQQKRVLT